MPRHDPVARESHEFLHLGKCARAPASIYKRVRIPSPLTAATISLSVSLARIYTYNIYMYLSSCQARAASCKVHYSESYLTGIMSRCIPAIICIFSLLGSLPRLACISMYASVYIRIIMMAGVYSSYRNSLGTRVIALLRTEYIRRRRQRLLCPYMRAHLFSSRWREIATGNR